MQAPLVISQDSALFAQLVADFAAIRTDPSLNDDQKMVKSMALLLGRLTDSTVDNGEGGHLLQVVNLNKSGDNILTEIDNIQTHLASTDNQLQDATTEVATLESTTAGLTQSVNGLDTRVVGVESSMNDLATDVRQLNIRMDETSGALDDIETRLECIECKPIVKNH